MQEGEVCARVARDVVGSWRSTAGGMYACREGGVVGRWALTRKGVGHDGAENVIRGMCKRV